MYKINKRQRYITKIQAPLFQGALATLLFLIAPVTAGKFDSAVRGFEKYPGYVQPIATLLGSINTSGWNRSASVGEEWRMSIGLPLSITVLSDKDRSYSGQYVDTRLLENCVQIRNTNPALADSLEPLAYQNYTTPTIFGKESDAAPVLKSYNLDLTGHVATVGNVYLSDGIPNIAAFNWLPAGTLQITLSSHNTELRLRWIGVPTKRLAINFPGFGFQHDLRSTGLKLPVDLSLFTDATFPILNWTPGDGIDGTFTMRGSTIHTGLCVGKKIGPAEFFFEGGWEHSRLKTGGELYVHEDSSWVRPNMLLRGRNSVRVTLTAAIHSKKTVHTIAGRLGAQTGVAVDPITCTWPLKRINDRIARKNESPSTDAIQPTLAPVVESPMDATDSTTVTNN